MRTLGLTWLVLATACRIGFESPALIDGAPEPDAPPDSPPPPVLLPCGEPVRLSIAATTEYLTAVATPRGYYVFSVDDARAVRGYAFQFVGETLELVPGTGNVLAVPPAVGPVAALVLDDTDDDVDVVIAVPYEPPGVATTTLGTVVVPFNAQLQRVDAPETATMNDGLLTIPGGLAAGDGTIAILAKDSGGFLQIQPVSRRGVALGPARPVNTGGHTVTRASLIRAATGYLAVWGDNMSQPESVAAARVDENLAASEPVVIYMNPEHSSFLPGAAYSARSRKYLFGWAEKLQSSQGVRLSMRGEDLADTPPIDLAESGGAPVIVAGDSDFLVVWLGSESLGQPLGAARVFPDGSFELQSVRNSGGDAKGYDVVVRHGQPALFWAEALGSGPNLWANALCN